MMLYPSIDKLLQKIPSKYSLIGLASKRAKEMRVKDTFQLEDYKSAKPVGKALEEIAEEQLYIVDAETYEQAIQEATERVAYQVSEQEQL